MLEQYRPILLQSIRSCRRRQLQTFCVFLVEEYMTIHHHTIEPVFPVHPVSLAASAVPSSLGSTAIFSLFG